MNCIFTGVREWGGRRLAGGDVGLVVLGRHADPKHAVRVRNELKSDGVCRMILGVRREDFRHSPLITNRPRHGRQTRTARRHEANRVTLKDAV